MTKAMLLRIGAFLCCCFLPFALPAGTNNSTPLAPQYLKPPKLVMPKTNNNSVARPANPDAKQELKQELTDKESIDKYVWLGRMKKLLPMQLCNTNEYFLRCFEIDEATCKQFTEIYLTACLDQISPKLPAEMATEDGQKWGQMMGHCTHDLFNKFMADKRKTLPECANVSKLKSTSPKT